MLSDRPPVWILLVTRGNYFLESLLAGHANASVNVVNSVSSSSFEQQVLGNHIVIMDGLEPPPLQVGNFLLINTSAPNLPITVKGLLTLRQSSTGIRQTPSCAPCNYATCKCGEPRS